MSKRCLVYRCINEEHEGNFVGNICVPCHRMLTTGDVDIRSENFISRLVWDINRALSRVQK